MAMNYKKAGVDIDAGNRFVQKIKPLVRSTQIAGSVGSLGGFSGLFRPDFKKYRQPLLVSATDGVGTKLKIAEIAGKHDTVGIDLVAMSVNDLIVTGAKPLFFLDYFATGKLKVGSAVQVVKGITAGCRQAGCSLLGGETAEMPGFYPDGVYDLAGFAVGIVDKQKMLPGKVKAGQVVLGLASSGPHSNGYSLIRKVFSRKELQGNVGKKLLAPTKIYVKPLLKLLEKCKVSGLVHITGGGFYDNIPRVMPKGLTATIQKGSWPIPSVFKTIQTKGKINDREMFRTFNMGIGMIAILGKCEADKACKILRAQKIQSWIIGEVTKGRKVGIQ